MENRASFFDRLRPIVPPARLFDIEWAYISGKGAFHWKTRTECDEFGVPVRYFEHLRRTALILIDEAGIVDSDLICAALLHDALEDTKDLTPALIEHFLGSEVTRMVMLVSKKPRSGYERRLLAHGDWKALLIKACDRLDNLRSMGPGQVTPEFRTRKHAETRDYYYPMLVRLLDLAPTEFLTGITSIVNQIHELAYVD